MNEQVLSIEQMQHLIELGVAASGASMAWCKPEGDKEYHLLLPNSQRSFEYDLVVKYIPTFTLQDMLSMMPAVIDKNWNESNLAIFFYENSASICYEGDYENRVASFCEDSLLKSAYLMLCWLAENGYLNKK